MIKCHKCESYSVEFDKYFRRPRCFDCGWLPQNFTNLSGCSFAFEPCNHCWGYEELRCNSNCAKCKNTGKVLNVLGREVLEVVNGLPKGGLTSRVVVKQSGTRMKYKVVQLVNYIYFNIGSSLRFEELESLMSEGVEVVVR